MAVFTIFKPIGLTPLQAVDKFKKKNPRYKNSKISYAGRLDPLARGKMTILTAKDRFDAKTYQDMDKIYVFKVLLGFSTDSYDLLGIPKIAKLINDINENDIKKFTKEYSGKMEQEYPPFSAKTVKGKKLFWWARNSRLNEIKIPKKNITIYKLEYLDKEMIDKEKLLNNILNKIEKVEGDFRQKEIINKWKKLFSESNRDYFFTYKFKVYCSSGTYVREIANKLGEYLRCGAVCVDIHRTRIVSPFRDDSSHKGQQ